MKMFFTGQYQQTPRNLARRCGYGEQVTRQGKVSYTKRLGGGQFPRFHAYVDTKKDGFTINLHMDQKAACYESVSAHSGEYESDVVQREGDRIKSIIIEYAHT